MRPWSRRRPAGVPQVLSIQTPAPVLVARLQPTVVRLAVNRGMVDTPWGIPPVAIANVWPENHGNPRWMRVAWPLDRRTRRFLAPVDLQIGHVLEIVPYREAPRYAWVADADQNRFILAPASDAAAAALAAWYAVDLWRAAEVAEIEITWRTRLGQIQNHTTARTRPRDRWRDASG